MTRIILVSTVENFFGTEIDPLLKTYAVTVPSGRALDIGCGNGASTYWLRQQGFNAIGIDIKLPKHLPAQFFQQEDILKYEIKDQQSIIVANNVLQYLSWNQKISLLNTIFDKLKIGGIFFFTTFSIQDPSFQRALDKGLPVVDKLSFWNEDKNCHQSYFELGKVKEWAENKFFNILHYSEGLIDDNHLPLGNHQHGLIQFVGQKTDSCDIRGRPIRYGDI